MATVPSATVPSRRRALLSATVAAALLLGAPSGGLVGFTPVALAATSDDPTSKGGSIADAQEVVDHASGTIGDLRNDKSFGNAQQLIRSARAVLIAPRLFKAGFFVGGEGGSGVLLVRQGRGWSNPAFYTLGSASFGLQIGAQEAEMIMIINSDKALQALMKSQFKVGADAGITVATLGSNVGSATTTSGTVADIVVWASSTGAFAGLAVDGTLIEPRDSYNQAYYGRALKPADIVRSHSGGRADSLRRALATV